MIIFKRKNILSSSGHFSSIFIKKKQKKKKKKKKKKKTNRSEILNNALKRIICREAGIELFFICGSSSRPLEQIFSMSIISLWVEPRALLAY